MFGIDDLIGGIAAPVIGGLVGNLTSSGDRAQAMAQQQQALEQWLKVHVPDPESQKLILDRYQSTGQLSPQLVQALQQQKSQLSDIRTNPALQQAQLDALGQLQQEGLSGGLSLQDQAAQQNAQIQTNADARGRQGAIQQDFAQRGMGGSGLDLQARMMAAQGANQTTAQNSLNAAAQSRQRALQAIQGAGQLGGQIQQQQFGQQAAQAQAQDAINNFNTRNMQNTMGQNAAWQNEANQYNLNRSQQLANSNVDIGNSQQAHNKNLYQQQFQNQATKAAGMSGQYGNMANAYNQQAGQQAGMWAGIGSGVGQGFIANSIYGKKQNQTQSQPYDQNAWSGDSTYVASSEKDPNNWDYAQS